jgi:phosphoenolpyruvate carboxykinase (GTP)
MPTTHSALKSWVQEVASLTKPEHIHWCDGSAEEHQSLIQKQVADHTLIPLNPKTHPDCYLHRSDPSDVARTEHLTFVCTKNKDDAGPNNNWMDPKEAHKKLDQLFQGSMKGRTLYVIPYCMGPLDSPYSRLGVEITDSPYVVTNMHLMTRMGKDALARIEKEGVFVKGLHSTGDLSVERRMIGHFPEELAIKSIGSGYGGNALLGKKCHALRLGSYQARREGWLAEHMLLLAIETPEKKTHYVAAGFPSACGKTNLAMLIPPKSYQDKGWKITTVGDDIAWIHVGHDGKLYGINPEAGFFGVAPGTSEKTNPNALAMLNRNTIFTNVGVTQDNQPWWEGLTQGVPYRNWKGELSSQTPGPAAHPNSRFTVSAKQCPSYSPQMENPLGVPLSAVIFGGRRPALMPLVLEAKNWAHGILMGATVASETTAAATGALGVLRRDPMAMKPFCGYHFGDYWNHWLSLAQRTRELPRIFHVNWFRQDQNKNYMWPGFSDNMRVLEWMIRRCEGSDQAVSTPVGYLPSEGSLCQDGLSVSDQTMGELCSIDPSGWVQEMEQIEGFLKEFEPRVPGALWQEHKRISQELRG